MSGGQEKEEEEEEENSLMLRTLCAPVDFCMLHKSTDKV